MHVTQCHTSSGTQTQPLTLWIMCAPGTQLPLAARAGGTSFKVSYAPVATRMLVACLLETPAAAAPSPQPPACPLTLTIKLPLATLTSLRSKLWMQRTRGCEGGEVGKGTATMTQLKGKSVAWEIKAQLSEDLCGHARHCLKPDHPLVQICYCGCSSPRKLPDAAVQVLHSLLRLASVVAAAARKASW